MKNNLKFVVKLLLSWIISFILIYLFVFFGGYKFFETSDIIMKEIGISFIIGIIILFVYELFANNSNKIEELEKRIEELEKDK